MGRHAKQLKGLKFGKLTAVECVRLGKKVGAIWLCYCECGQQREVAANRLLTGTTKACRKCALKSLSRGLKKRTFVRWNWGQKLASFNEWQLKGYHEEIKRRAGSGEFLNYQTHRAIVNEWYRKQPQEKVA